MIEEDLTQKFIPPKVIRNFKSEWYVYTSFYPNWSNISSCSNRPCDELHLLFISFTSACLHEVFTAAVISLLSQGSNQPGRPVEFFKKNVNSQKNEKYFVCCYTFTSLKNRKNIASLVLPIWFCFCSIFWMHYYCVQQIFLLLISLLSLVILQVCCY